MIKIAVYSVQAKLRVQAYMNLYSSTYQATLAGLRLRRAIGNL